MSDRVHPIIECADDLRSALKGVSSVEPVFMTTGEKQSALVALTAARSQLDALTARVLAASDDVGEVHGLRDASAWLAVETRRTRQEARRDLALGRALEEHPELAGAMTAGELRAEQARVIAAAVDALPAAVDVALGLVHLSQVQVEALRDVGSRLFRDADHVEEPVRHPDVGCRELAALHNEGP